VALEFAIIALPFFTWLLFIFELSYDLFTQEALDYALNAAVRQIQVGNANAENLSTGQTFIRNALCPAAKGLLECKNMWLRVTAVPNITDSTNVSAVATVTGGYLPPTTTTGAVPVNANGFNTTGYINVGSTGIVSQTSPPYCLAQSSQAILVSVIYLGPTFVGGLLPGLVSVNSPIGIVHPTLSTAGFVTEPFQPPPQNPRGTVTATPAPQCSVPTPPKGS
jgi:Flp pilus assembly protein TadG